jgi:hypothetical protein
VEVSPILISYEKIFNLKSISESKLSIDHQLNIEFWSARGVPCKESNI